MRTYASMSDFFSIMMFQSTFGRLFGAGINRLMRNSDPTLSVRVFSSELKQWLRNNLASSCFLEDSQISCYHSLLRYNLQYAQVCCQYWWIWSNIEIEWGILSSSCSFGTDVFYIENMKLSSSGAFDHAKRWFTNRTIAASRKTRFNADSVFEQVNETIGRRGAPFSGKKPKDRGNNFVIAVFPSRALLRCHLHVSAPLDFLSRLSFGIEFKIVSVLFHLSGLLHSGR